MAAVAVVLLLSILQLAVHGYAISPPPGSVTVGDVSAAGDGCPEGTYTAVVSDDAHALTVMFSDFTAVTDKALGDRRKQCVVSLQLNYPQGFTFTLVDIILRGYANLDEGVKGVLQTSYYFSGQPGTADAPVVKVGKFDANFEEGATFISPVVSVCNQVRNLNIRTEVRVEPGNFTPKRHGIVTVDSQDLKLTQIFAFSWEAC
ncbi:hypothetical protein CBR_g9175 [Chara braunii]|uniref:DUF4360 domain-containing protein n=1 Tax=Chara braunii TaxID=69332 RepID=A0A388KP06_CHABU|nr:hypothetical protein CBR_g9175 [Chara braunii]|eukprot:GBG71767.1 hypothetical protein CBR_g9175 [Chara braunii]